jgi:hypothetical protein
MLRNMFHLNVKNRKSREPGRNVFNAGNTTPFSDLLHKQEEEEKRGINFWCTKENLSKLL